MHFTMENPHLLVPNIWNSNVVDRPNFEKLKKSLTEFGSFKPIVVRQVGDSMEILGGYHRCEAAKELGLKEVPVINLGKIDDDRAKKISLIDNTRYGEDDKAKLEALLEGLEDISFLDDLIPVDEINDALEAVTDETSDISDEPLEDEEYKTLKFRLDIDKAEEIEAILIRIADREDYKYRDGYANLADALYHALVLDKYDD